MSEHHLTYRIPAPAQNKLQLCYEGCAEMIFLSELFQRIEFRNRPWPKFPAVENPSEKSCRLQPPPLIVNSGDTLAGNTNGRQKSVFTRDLIQKVSKLLLRPA